MITFYDGFGYSDGESFKKSHHLKETITAIPLQSCIPIFLDSLPSTPDLLLSACLRTKLLDLSKQYSLCYTKLFDDRILVLASEQKSLKFISIPEIFLPFGNKDLLDNSMFCFENSLAIFYQKRLLHFSKNDDFSDIFNALEMIREKYGIEISTIYSTKSYDSINVKDFDTLGKFPIANLAISAYKDHKELFLQPQNPWYKTQLFIILLGFLGVFFTLLTFYGIANSHLDKLELKNLNIKSTPKSQSRYDLFASITNLASKYNILFEQMDFVSQKEDFALGIYACFSRQIDFVNWIDKMEDKLKTPSIYADIQNINSNYHCTWISWVKQ